MKKPYYPAIDIVKIVCAFLIVFIHTSPLESVNGALNSFLVNCVCRVAVPFFFISSGFLLFGRAGTVAPDGKTVSRYLKRILTLYLIWSAVYFPYTLLRMHWRRSVSGAVEVFLNWLKNMFFTAGYGLLWYLPSTIVAVAVVWFLLKRGLKTDTIVVIGAVLYCIGLCGQSYFGLVSMIPFPDAFRRAVKTVFDFIVTTRNGLFEGVILIALGAKLSEKKDFGSLGKALTGFFVSALLFCGEFVAVSKLGWRLGFDMYIFIVPCAYFMLKTALCAKIEIRPKALEFLRPYSILIYFTHMIPIELFTLFFPNTEINSVLMCFSVIAVTLLLDTAIIFASRTAKLGFLKKIY